MKRFLFLLVVLGALAFSCSPKLSYFYRETNQPQVVVDSLMGDWSSDFRTWKNVSVVGVNETDSTEIVTYIYRVEEGKSIYDISVVEFKNLNKDFVVKKQGRRN